MNEWIRVHSQKINGILRELEIQRLSGSTVNTKLNVAEVAFYIRGAVNEINSLSTEIENLKKERNESKKEMDELKIKLDQLKKKYGESI